MVERPVLSPTSICCGFGACVKNTLHKLLDRFLVLYRSLDAIEKLLPWQRDVADAEDEEWVRVFENALRTFGQARCLGEAFPFARQLPK